jgi:small nuclear ribonucleoprotein (snRNP)-like protein
MNKKRKIYLGEVDEYLNDLRDIVLEKSTEKTIENRIKAIDETINLLLQYGKENIKIGRK